MSGENAYFSQLFKAADPRMGAFFCAQAAKPRAFAADTFVRATVGRQNSRTYFSHRDCIARALPPGTIDVLRSKSI
jgi:uncharacterized protein YfaA (DUF2138 family)